MEIETKWYVGQRELIELIVFLFTFCYLSFPPLGRTASTEDRACIFSQLLPSARVERKYFKPGCVCVEKGAKDVSLFQAVFFPGEQHQKKLICTSEY